MQSPEVEFVSAPVARATIFGGISEVTEWRYARDLPDFPKPVRVGKRKYYKVLDARAFMERRMVA